MSNIYVTFLFYPIYVLGSLNTNLQEYYMKLMGGKRTSIGDYPSVVSIQYVTTSLHVCTGSIVSDRWILSAAHCFCRNSSYCEISKDDVSQYRIVAGSSDIWGFKSDVPQLIWVCYVEPHPDFRIEETTKNGESKILNIADIALLYVDRSIEFSPNVQKSFLATPDILELKNPYAFFRDLEGCVAVGWGTEGNFTSLISKAIRKVELPLISIFECLLAENRIIFGVNHSCTAWPPSETCYGDSGSPLFCNNIQVGVGSMGKDCFPGIWTRVDQYFGWIEKVRKENITIAFTKSRSGPQEVSSARITTFRYIFLLVLFYDK